MMFMLRLELRLMDLLFWLYCPCVSEHRQMDGILWEQRRVKEHITFWLEQCVNTVSRYVDNKEEHKLLVLALLMLVYIW